MSDTCAAIVLSYEICCEVDALWLGRLRLGFVPAFVPARRVRCRGRTLHGHCCTSACSLLLLLIVLRDWARTRACSHAFIQLLRYTVYGICVHSQQHLLSRPVVHFTSPTGPDRWPLSTSGNRPSLVGEQLALLAPLVTPDDSASGPYLPLASVNQFLSSPDSAGIASGFGATAPCSSGLAQLGSVTLSLSPQPSSSVAAAAQRRNSGVVGGGPDGRVVIYRGLRVRMGCASVTPECRVTVETSFSAGSFSF